MEINQKRYQMNETQKTLGTMTEAEAITEFYKQWAYALMESCANYRTQLSVAIDGSVPPCYNAFDFREAERNKQWTKLPK